MVFLFVISIPSTTFAEQGIQPSNNIVMVIDLSNSMAGEDGSGRYLPDRDIIEKVKETCCDIVNSLPDGCNFAYVLFAGEIHDADRYTINSDTRSYLVEYFGQITADKGGTYISLALARAGIFAAQMYAENSYKTTIYVLSDGEQTHGDPISSEYIQQQHKWELYQVMYEGTVSISDSPLFPDVRVTEIPPDDPTSIIKAILSASITLFPSELTICLENINEEVESTIEFESDESIEDLDIQYEDIYSGANINIDYQLEQLTDKTGRLIINAYTTSTNDCNIRTFWNLFYSCSDGKLDSIYIPITVKTDITQGELVVDCEEIEFKLETTDPRSQNISLSYPPGVQISDINVECSTPAGVLLDYSITQTSTCEAEITITARVSESTIPNDDYQGVVEITIQNHPEHNGKLQVVQVTVQSRLQKSPWPKLLFALAGLMLLLILLASVIKKNKYKKVFGTLFYQEEDKADSEAKKDLTIFKNDQVIIGIQDVILDGSSGKLASLKVGKYKGIRTVVVTAEPGIEIDFEGDSKKVLYLRNHDVFTIAGWTFEWTSK